MPEWIAVSRTQHADTYYQPRQGYGFAAEQTVVPILLAEIAKLLPHYALGFIQQGEGAHQRYQPVALLGLDGQQNLYVHPDGRWLSNYVPAGLRGYPFRLANSEKGETVLAVNAEHLSDTQGEPLFDHDGALDASVQKTLDFLQQCERNRQTTHAACQRLAEIGVIEPWPLKIERGEGEQPLAVKGLYRINEKTLNELAAEAFADLRKHGALALAYAQLFSMSQLNQLTERATFHAKQQDTAQPPENLDNLFGDDDDLTFDFDN